MNASPQQKCGYPHSRNYRPAYEKYRVAKKSKLLTQYNSLLFLSHPVLTEVLAWAIGINNNNNNNNKHYFFGFVA